MILVRMLYIYDVRSHVQYSEDACITSNFDDLDELGNAIRDKRTIVSLNADKPCNLDMHPTWRLIVVHIVLDR